MFAGRGRVGAVPAVLARNLLGLVGRLAAESPWANLSLTDGETSSLRLICVSYKMYYVKLSGGKVWESLPCDPSWLLFR